jgi:hypothetical protein
MALPLALLTQILRQRIVDVSGCDGGVAGADGNLVKVGHDIPEIPQLRGILHHQFNALATAIRVVTW